LGYKSGYNSRSWLPRQSLFAVRKQSLAEQPHEVGHKIAVFFWAGCAFAGAAAIALLWNATARQDK